MIVGLVYNYLPFVILACFASLSRLNPELNEASRDLGGSAFTTFRRVTLPLTVPGIAAGAVFVFVLSIGNFLTPALLGGGRFQMIGNLVYDQFLTANDWPFGAALSMVLIALMIGAAHAAGAGRRPARRRNGRDRAEATMAERRRRLGARLQGLVLALVFAFLYVPIAVLVALSFNEGGLPTVWSGFSTKWYVSLASNDEILSAALNTLIVAAGLDRHRHPARHAAGDRRRDAAEQEPRPRGADLRADDHPRHRAGDRAPLLLLACSTSPWACTPSSSPTSSSTSPSSAWWCARG